MDVKTQQGTIGGLLSQTFPGMRSSEENLVWKDKTASTEKKEAKSQSWDRSKKGSAEVAKMEITFNKTGRADIRTG